MKGANITYENVSFSDIRFELLAHELGLADADHARGKLGRLWLECTETQSYTVSLAVIARVLGPAGVDALITAELGQLTSQHERTPFASCAPREPIAPRGPEPVMRLRGTLNRIEWYGRNRSSSRAGGLAKQAAERSRAVKKSVGNPVDNLSVRQDGHALTEPADALIESQVASRLASQVESHLADETLSAQQSGSHPASQVASRLASPLIRDPRSKISDQNQSCEEVGVDELVLQLSALRTRIAIRTGESDAPAPRVSPTEREQLAELLTATQANGTQVSLALAQLEVLGEQRLDARAVTVEAFRRLLAASGARAPAKRAELRVVRDGSLDGVSEEVGRG